MPTNIYMPALSPTMEEGTLSKWLVKIGDKIKAGDIIAEIETDKATMEVEAVDEGIVTSLLVNDQTKSIPVNSVIAILDGSKDESLNFKEKKTIKKVKQESEKDKTDNIEIKNYNNLPNDENNDFEIKKNLDEKIISSPIARKIALEKNIDLKNIIGSGPKGRIIKRDLEKNLDIFKNQDESLITPSSMRKIIAERTTNTKQTVPHFYLTIESNVDKLLEMRKTINNSSDTKISINDILVKALAQAQKNNPLTKSSWIDGKIKKYENVDVSIAVALKDGLITPIIKNADTKGLVEISQEIKELVEKANKGLLTVEEYNGGTISISNLGMFGISEFSAIINPPQSSILAVGEIKKIPRYVDDEIKGVNILKSTLSVDHRVLDGAIGGKLLKDFNDIIEDPFDLWLMSDDMKII